MGVSCPDSPAFGITQGSYDTIVTRADSGSFVSTILMAKSEMDTHGSITQWLELVRQGDSQAVQEIWNRYYQRLIGLARTKLKGSPRRVADEDDVVTVAFDSFLRGAAAGRFPRLDDRDDLWQVLVMLTARKAVNQVKHEQRQKRGGGHVRGESALKNEDASDSLAGIDQVVGSEPTPEFAADVTEQVEDLLARLDDETLQGVAIAKMEGYTNDEIAERIGVKTRTIERKLRIIREIWSESE